MKSQMTLYLLEVTIAPFAEVGKKKKEKELRLGKRITVRNLVTIFFLRLVSISSSSSIPWPLRRNFTANASGTS